MLRCILSSILSENVFVCLKNQISMEFHVFLEKIFFCVKITFLSNFLKKSILCKDFGIELEFEILYSNKELKLLVFFLYFEA